MRVRVLDAIRDAHHSWWITFDSAVGAAGAAWASKASSPEIGREYDVELDVGVGIDMAVNAMVSESSTLGVRAEGGAIVMNAIVDNVYDDGVVCLRLAVDAIVLVDAEGEFHVGKILKISLPPDSLSVTPIGS